MSKSLYRSELSTTKKTSLLAKIKALVAEKSSRLVVDFKGFRFYGNRLTSFTIDDSLATGTILLNAGSFYGVAAALVILQDLTFTAKVVNSFYANNTRIKYINPGALSALSVAVDGRDIIVTLAHDGSAVTSTATLVKAAIEAYAPAAALVSIAISGTGSNLQAAAAFTALAGGSNVQSFDKADIDAIRRLRTKKYLIKINASANPA